MLYIKNTVQYKIRQDLIIDHPLIEICLSKSKVEVLMYVKCYSWYNL